MERMVNYIIVGIVVVLLILAVGYFSLTYIQFGGVNDPKEMLKSYGERFNHTDKLKLTYLFKVPIAATFYPSFSTGIPIEFYKLGQDAKVLVSMEGIGTSAVYIKNGKTISCTESSLTTLGSRVQCSVQENIFNTFTPQVNESLINQTKVTYTGVKRIAGRNCDDFSISLNESQLGYIQNQVPSGVTGFASLPDITGLTSASSQNKTSLMLELCMDKQYGYPALLNISMSSYSVLSGKSTTKNVLSMEVTDMSTQVTENDLEVPVAFVLEDVRCTQNSVDFDLTSFRDIQNPTINVTLSSYSQTVSATKNVDSLTEGRSYPFNVTLSQPLSGYYYTAEVCIGGDCQSDYCFVSQYYPSYQQPSSSSGECYSHGDCWYTNYSTGCCLGQCNLTTHKCYSSPQSADYTSYGQEYYCTGGQTCGDDCKCH